MKPYENIKLTTKDKIGIIEFNRPQKLNAINTRLVEELNHILDIIEFDDAIRVLIITGNERSFSAGRDLKEERPKGGLKKSHLFYNRLETFRKVIVAAIEGHCLGAGLEIALCCDLRIASEKSNIGLPEVNVGSFPAGGGSFRLPRLIGIEKAKMLIYSGDTINGREALELGLVAKAAAPGKALAEAITLANRLTQKAPLSLIIAKASINAGLNIGLDNETAIQYVCDLYNYLQGTADYQQMRKNFKNKKKDK